MAMILQSLVGGGLKRRRSLTLGVGHVCLRLAQHINATSKSTVSYFDLRKWLFAGTDPAKKPYLPELS